MDGDMRRFAGTLLEIGEKLRKVFLLVGFDRSPKAPRCSANSRGRIRE
jgi:hypothetical protein